MADEAAQDEAGLVVKERFIQFINGYQPPADHVDNDDAQRSAGMICSVTHTCVHLFLLTKIQSYLFVLLH